MKTIDELAIEKTLNGEAEAFADIVMRHRMAVMRLCLFACGEYETASRMLRRTFLAFANHMVSHRNQGDVHNLLINHAAQVISSWEKRGSRRVGKIENLRNNLEQAFYFPSEELERLKNTSMAELQKSFVNVAVALGKYPVHQKLVMGLKAFEGRSYNNIAKLSGIDPKKIQTIVEDFRKSILGGYKTDDDEEAELEQMLGLFVDNELAPIKAARLQEELKQNDRLRKRMSEFIQLRDRLTSAFAYFAPPDDIVEQIIKGMPDPKRLLSVPRFGEIATAMGFVEQEAIEAALKEQRKLKARGHDELLGSILVERGSMDKKTVQRVLEVQGEQGKPETLADCEIVEQVGKGGMGVVYRAHQQSMGRDVAVKVLYPKLAKDEKFVESFLTEGKAVAHLAHPNVVTGIDVGEHQGFIYLIMEFVDGPTLREWLGEHEVMDESTALDMAIQVSAALDYAYKNNFIHRDIKPDNIMLDRNGVAKVCDLGLAISGEQDLFDEDGVVGTPHYLSPEQARGERNLDTRSDIYSFGATLYHVLTGSTPYSGEDSREIMEKHAFSDIQPPSERNPDISEAFESIIMKMMARDRDLRYPTPGDLQRDLELLKAGKRPVAYQEKLILEGKLDPKMLFHADRTPQLVIGIVAFLVITLTGMYFLFQESIMPQQETTSSYTPPPTPTPTVLRSGEFFVPSISPEQAKADYEKLEQMAEASEDPYQLAIACGTFIEKYPGTKFIQKVLELRIEAFNAHNKLVEAEIEKRFKKAKELVTHEEYVAALNHMYGLPEHMRASPAFNKVKDKIDEINIAIEDVVFEEVDVSLELAGQEEFTEATDKLKELINKVPPEYVQQISNTLVRIEKEKYFYVISLGKNALTKILSYFIEGEFDQADKLVKKLTTDPAFAEFAPMIEQSKNFFSSIRSVIEHAMKRAKELEGGTVILRLDNGSEVQSRILKVNDDSTLDVIFMAAGEKKTLSISDLSSYCIADLARSSISNLPADKKGEQYLSLAVYEFLTGLFELADKDIEHARKFKADPTIYGILKNNFGDVVKERFALKTLQRLRTARKNEDWEAVERLAKELLGKFSATNAVLPYLDTIRLARSQASLNLTGIKRFFNAPVSMDARGLTQFTYDLSNKHQMKDFGYMPEKWSLENGKIVQSEDFGLGYGLHHPAFFKDRCEVEFTYSNEKSNSLFVYMCGVWIGLNAHNSTADALNELPRDKTYKAFYGNDIEFGMVAGDTYRMRYVVRDGKVSVFANDKLVFEKHVTTKASGVEIRDLGFAQISELVIRGKIDEQWLATIAELNARIEAGELTRGLTRIAYGTLNFSRRLGDEVVSEVNDHFAVGPSKRLRKPTWSAKYKGFLMVPERGEYKLYIRTTARTSVRVNGKRVHDNTSTGGVPDSFLTITLQLEAGLNEFEFSVANDDIPDQTIWLGFGFETDSKGSLPPIMLYTEP
ncbi:MAG: protein kinase [Planctomycetota bacterium]|nr:protein kinase [Planctomycetota bacterium]